MPISRRAPFYTLVVSVSLISLIAGCGDVLFINEQLAEIRIVDVASGEDVSGAVVTIAPEGRGGNLALADLTDDEYLDRLPNDSQTTGDDGKVVLTLNSSIVCGSPTTCDPLQDQVTGELYLIRVESNGASEILTVEMVVDNSVSGESLTATVVSIGQPTSVP